MDTQEDLVRIWKDNMEAQLKFFFWLITLAWWNPSHESLISKKDNPLSTFSSMFGHGGGPILFNSLSFYSSKVWTLVGIPSFHLGLNEWFKENLNDVF